MRLTDTEILIRDIRNIYQTKLRRGKTQEYLNGMWDTLKLIEQYSSDCHLLTLEEIRDLPWGTVIWEEVRIDWEKIETKTPEDKGVDITIAPVVKRGDQLMDNSCTTDIDKDMFGNPERGDQFRYWSNCPTDEEREKAKWET